MRKAVERKSANFCHIYVSIYIYIYIYIYTFLYIYIYTYIQKYKSECIPTLSCMRTKNHGSTSLG